MRGRAKGKDAIVVKRRVRIRRSGARRKSTVVGDRRVRFVPRRKSALVEL